MKTRIIVIIFIFILIAQQCNATEAGRGIDGWLLSKMGGALNSLFFIDDTVIDDGMKGPHEENGYLYVGTPRVCINLVNGKVRAGQHNGRHELKVMRQKKVEGIDGLYFWEDDVLVYEASPDVETISVEEDKSYPWDLNFMYSHDISINYASGTMKGCMEGAKAGGVLAVTALAIAIITL